MKARLARPEGKGRGRQREILMSASFLNITFSPGDRRKALICEGRCASFVWLAGGATSSQAVMRSPLCLLSLLPEMVEMASERMPPFTGARCGYYLAPFGTWCSFAHTVAESKVRLVVRNGRPEQRMTLKSIAFRLRT